MEESHLLLAKEMSLGNIKKDEESTFGAYQCLICNCQLSGLESALSHASGGQHQRKCKAKSAAAEIDAGVSTALNKATITDVDTVPPEDSKWVEFVTAEEFRCKVCNIAVNGFIPLKAHLIGKAHLRKVKCYEIGQQLNSQQFMASDIQPAQSLSSGSVYTSPKRINSTKSTQQPKRLSTGQRRRSSSSSDGYVSCEDNDAVSAGSKNPFLLEDGDKYKCTLCNIECTGEDNIAAHFKGKAHLKAVKRSGCILPVQPTKDDDFDVSKNFSESEFEIIKADQKVPNFGLF